MANDVLNPVGRRKLLAGLGIAAVGAAAAPPVGRGALADEGEDQNGTCGAIDMRLRCQ